VRPPLQLMCDRNPVCATLYRIWESQGDVDADLKEQLNGVTVGNRCELVPTQRCLHLLVFHMSCVLMSQDSTAQQPRRICPCISDPNHWHRRRDYLR
jgi:hypothetical protein